MILNKWVIFWNNQPIGIDLNSGGYPFKTENPNNIKYWISKEEAIKYCDMFPNNRMWAKEIQFRILESN